LRRFERKKVPMWPKSWRTHDAVSRYIAWHARFGFATLLRPYISTGVCLGYFGSAPRCWCAQAEQGADDRIFAEERSASRIRGRFASHLTQRSALRKLWCSAHISGIESETLFHTSRAEPVLVLLTDRPTSLCDFPARSALAKKASTQFPICPSENPRLSKFTAGWAPRRRRRGLLPCRGAPEIRVSIWLSWKCVRVNIFLFNFANKSHLN